MLSLTSINNLALANTEQFEQAYAPVMVGNITTFIPIEIKVPQTVLVSLKKSNSSYLLEWSPVSSADYYKVEQFVDGKWQSLALQLNSNKFTVSNLLSSEFRVTACNRYGCSETQKNNHLVDGGLTIEHFKVSSDIVRKGEAVTLSWSVKNVSQIRVESSDGKIYRDLQPNGRLQIRPEKFTSFNLVTSGFQQSKSMKTAIVVEQERKEIETPYTGYLEPLRNKGFDVISRTLLELPQGLVFSTHDEELGLVNKSGDVLWLIKLEGIVANRVTYNQDKNWINFSVSKLDNTGQSCAVDIATGHIEKCNDLQSPAIASPLLLKTVENGVAVTRVANIDMEGKLYLANVDTMRIEQTISLPPELKAQKITSNIAVIDGTSQFVMRVTDSKYAALSVTPVEDSTMCNSLSSCGDSLMKVFSSSNEEDNQSEKLELKIDWIKEHK
ncbi:hypothetical protein C1E23_13255 [Pseudoalteromonas phenolica]|uniref:Fibronectin type-III domain-containing protein n=1 Tax=Pseudoalteromonas phenolica TaxID=161398 RepID=A0A4Q7ILQ6_9GAMM|nr:hypothetical protein C1E23_13255 [Pseudoalteromonas phenolica]